MARHQKSRRICSEPQSVSLINPGASSDNPAEALTMTVDEYETIRLIDLEGLSQEECAARMNVARTTVQAIYNTARGKLAQALILNRELIVSGGNYVVCNGEAECVECKKKDDTSGYKGIPKNGI
ncbi:MAG: DUF134 domain-containing protein [Clostridia bacterium]|nr:DUF134 domain-containing protein [Clostridia bacterium]